MTTRQIGHAHREILLAGAPKDREHVQRSWIDRVEFDVRHLGQQAASVAADFRSRLTTWCGTAVSDTTEPFASIADTRIASLYGGAAFVALVGEMLLAAWFFDRQGVDWRVGAASAVVVTIVFYAGIYYLTYGVGGHVRPLETVFRLRLFIRPAIALFFVAVVLGVLPRYLEGDAAASQDVHNLLSAGLLIGTISLLVLAAALKCGHFTYSWSARYADRFAALTREQHMTDAFLAELKRELAASATAPGAPVVADLQNAGVARAPLAGAAMTTAAATGMAIVLASTLAACTATASSDPNAPSVAASTVDPDVLPSCEVEVDVSGSPIDIEAEWNQFKTTIPQIVRQLHCSTLMVSTLDEDGWRPRVAQQIKAPVMKTAVLPKLRSEWRDMKNVKDARAERLRKLQVEAERTYTLAVDDALSALDSIEVSPGPHYESSSTDIAGAIRRYAQYHGRRTRMVFLLSDLGDSHYRRLPIVAKPAGSINVIAVVLPMKEKDARLLGQPISGSDQYENRVRWLHAGAPWIQVAPSFTTDFSDLLPASSTGR